MDNSDRFRSAGANVEDTAAREARSCQCYTGAEEVFNSLRKVQCACSAAWHPPGSRVAPRENVTEATDQQRKGRRHDHGLAVRANASTRVLQGCEKAVTGLFESSLIRPGARVSSEHARARATCQ
eukprot:2304997-Rhodomonas_salina.6